MIRNASTADDGVHIDINVDVDVDVDVDAEPRPCTQIEEVNLISAKGPNEETVRWMYGLDSSSHTKYSGVDVLYGYERSVETTINRNEDSTKSTHISFALPQIDSSVQLERRQHMHKTHRQHESEGDLTRAQRVVNKAHALKRVITSAGRDVHIGQQIGCGGYSRCYLSRDNDGKVYAAKVIARRRGGGGRLRKHKNSDRSEAISACSEILIHSSLHHPYIVEFLEYVEHDKYTVILLEYCSNSSLQDFVQNRGKLTEREACYFLQPIVSAVEYLHNQCIHHGDLKLSNILLDDYMRPKLADFGFAKRLVSVDQQRTKLCGTPSYMAPEIIIKPSRFGLPADVWAIGVTTYTMLYGSPPFDASSLEKLYRRIVEHDLHMEVFEMGLSFAAFSFIEHALHPDPDARPTIKALSNCPWFRIDWLGGLPVLPKLQKHAALPCEVNSVGKSRLKYAVKDFIGRKLRIKKLHKSADHIAGL